MSKFAASLIQVFILGAATLFLNGCFFSFHEWIKERSINSGPVSYNLVFTTQPSSTVASGAPLATGGTIKVEDNSGNVITSGALASATISLSDSTGVGNISGARTVAAVNGVAVIPSNTLVFEKGGTKSIAAQTTVSGFGTITGQSASIDVTVPSVANVSLFSGIENPAGNVDGTGTSARLIYPSDMTSDGTYIYFIEGEGNRGPYPCVIRKYAIATGAVSSFVGQLYDCNNVDGGPGVGAIDFNGPDEAITNDGTYVYFTANESIERADIATQTIQYMAGGYPTGYVDSSTGSTAEFQMTGYDENRLWVSGTTLYVADNDNCVIRAIDTSNSNFPVSTFAGDGTCAEKDESAGAPLTAEFNQPQSLYGDANYLYVVDNSGIRRISWATGNVDTLETATNVTDLIESGSDLYATYSSLETIFTLDLSTGAYIQDVAGQIYNCGDIDGVAGTSLLCGSDFLYDYGSTIYVGDSANDTIRTLDTSTNTLTTVAGYTNAPMGWTDGTSTAATYMWPMGGASDGTYLYTMQSVSAGVLVARQISLANGSVTSHGSTWGLSYVGNPYEVMIGNTLYFTAPSNNKIYSTDPSTWALNTVAGTGASGNNYGAFSSATFSNLGPITTDGQSLYVWDNDVLKKLDLATSTVSFISGVSGSSSCAVGSATTSEYGDMNQNGGSLVYLNGELYAATGCFGGAIIQIDPTTGTSSIYAGNSTYGEVDGSFGNAEFSDCGGLGCPMTTDGTNLYLYDGDYGTVREISTGSSTVSTFWGNSTQRWQVDGTVGGTAREGDEDGPPYSIYYGYGKFYVITSRGVRVAQ